MNWTHVGEEPRWSPLRWLTEAALVATFLMATYAAILLAGTLADRTVNEPNPATCFLAVP